MSEAPETRITPAEYDDQFADDSSDDGVPPSVLFHAKPTLPTHITTASVSPANEAVQHPEPSDMVAPKSSTPPPTTISSATTRCSQQQSGTSLAEKITSKATSNEANKTPDPNEEASYPSKTGDARRSPCPSRQQTVAPSQNELPAKPILPKDQIKQATIKMPETIIPGQSAPLLAARPPCEANNIAQGGLVPAAPVLHQISVITQQPQAAYAPTLTWTPITKRSKASSPSSQPVSPSQKSQAASAPVIDFAETQKFELLESTTQQAVPVPETLVIPISSIETQVSMAARLVAQELENGGWPEVSPGARQQAAVALEEFARIMFLPNLLQGANNSAAPSNERVFLATMLALREVLTQNAERIFVIQDVPRQGEEERNNDAGPGNKRRKRHRDIEERQYMAQLYATGVIFAAIQSMPEAKSYLSKFTQIMDSYDTGDDDCASYMERVDGRHQGVLPNGKQLKNEENVAWRVSYNRVRDLHPVIRHNRQRVEQQLDPSDSRIDVPPPNAVLVSMVEKLPEARS